MELWSHGNTRQRSRSRWSSSYFRTWSSVFLQRILDTLPWKRFFGKSDLESKEEGRVESPFFKSSVSVKESEWKNRSMEFPSRIYLYTWPPSSSLRTAKKRRLRGRETGHMSRARKKRVRTVSSRFYFGSCPFLLRISGTGEWREHEFHRFLTYSALLQPSCGRDTRWKTI